MEGENLDGQPLLYCMRILMEVEIKFWKRRSSWDESSLYKTRRAEAYLGEKQGRERLGQPFGQP